MSSEKLLIVVTGATGSQGGSVARFLLEDGTFRVRAVTRNVDSAKAKELAAKGAEVVQGDLDDPASINKAFEGAYGAFGVTNFWEHMSSERETAQGKVLVDAAKKNGLKHFVWSTLEHSEDLKVEHFDGKFYVDEYLKQSGVPRTSLYTTFYFENFTSLFKLSKDSSGNPIANWPLLWSDGPIGAYSVTETGAFVLEALKNPSTYLSNDLRIQSSIFTPRQVVSLISSISGKQVKFVEVTREDFEKLRDVKESYELWANMEWFYRSNGNPGRDMDLTAQIYPKRQTTEDFVKANIEQLFSAADSAP